MRDLFQDATILITGGTGSFGEAFLRRCLEFPVREIRVFSRDEKKQYDMMHRYENPRLRFDLGDVRDIQTVDKAMEGVDFVFHAAAMKQVPSCEGFPLEAVKTNVMGSSNVIQSAIRHSVKKVVCLSTDKACYPTSAMGATKALMEKVALRAAGEQEKTIINLTRFGNLISSRGSVVPLFLDQLDNYREITVTEPDMTRFLMTLDDAIDLVMCAFEKGRQGEIFVHKSKAATVGDLVEAVQKYRDATAHIRYIGARPGEKMHETLLLSEEAASATDCGGFFRVQSKESGPPAYRPEEFDSSAAERYSIDELVELIRATMREGETL